MKNAPWILLSLAILALAYFMAATSSIVTATSDLGTLCRAAGFVSPPAAATAKPGNEPTMAMPKLQLGPNAQVNTIFKSPSSPPSKP